MCFSVEADLVAGAVVLPLGVLALRHVRDPREVPLASLPVLFGVHQLTEAAVWAAAGDGSISEGWARLAAWAYVVLALPVLPLLVPVAVWLVEDARHRARVLPFFALGAGVAAYLMLSMVRHGLEVVVNPHSLGYRVGMGPDDWLPTALYVVAVVGACFVASTWTLRAFGVANLVGLTVVAVAAAEAFASLWCVWAALSSVLVLVDMVHRARDREDVVARQAVAA